MGDTSVDWASFDPGIYTPSDTPFLSTDSSQPDTPAPVPGLFGTVGAQPMVSDGIATADSLSSTDGIAPNANLDSSWADGSAAVGLGGPNPTFWDSQGNILQSTTDADGLIHLSDGSIIDPATGNKWNADGNNAPIDPSVNSAGPLGTSGLGPVASIGKPGGSGSGSAMNLSALSKAIGNLGASLTSILANPRATTPQGRVAAQSTVAGLPSNLNMGGTWIFVGGALVVIYLLVRSH